MYPKPKGIGRPTHLFLGELLCFLRATTVRVLVRLKEVVRSVARKREGGGREVIVKHTILMKMKCHPEKGQGH